MSFLSNFTYRWKEFTGREKLGLISALVFLLIIGAGSLIVSLYFFGVLDVLIPYYYLLEIEINVSDFLFVRGFISFVLVLLIGLYLMDTQYEQTKSKWHIRLFKISRFVFYFVVAGWSWYFLGKTLLAMPIGCFAAARIVEWINKNNMVYKQEFTQEIFDEYNKSDPEKVSLEQYKREALIEWKRGNRDKSLQLYTKAIEIDPNDGVAILNRGNLQIEMGYFDAGISDLEKVREIDPNLPWQNAVIFKMLDPETREAVRQRILRNSDNK